MAMYPVRAGIFSTADSAIDLVMKLHSEGFSWDEISVVCSDETKKKLFPEQVEEISPEGHGNEAMNAVGVGLLGLGGLAATAAMLSTAGTAMVILGAFAGLATGGTFASLMATRGFESEATDYYEQSVQQGNILVAVDVQGDDEVAESRRTLAEQLISEAGAVPKVLSD